MLAGLREQITEPSRLGTQAACGRLRVANQATAAQAAGPRPLEWDRPGSAEVEGTSSQPSKVLAPNGRAKVLCIDRSQNIIGFLARQNWEFENSINELTATKAILAGAR